jgi:hypothetical protein
MTEPLDMNYTQAYNYDLYPSVRIRTCADTAYVRSFVELFHDETF